MAAYRDRLEVTFSDARRMVDWGVVWRIFYDTYRLRNYLDRNYQTKETLTGFAKVSALPEAVGFRFEEAAADAVMAADEAVIDISLKGIQCEGWSTADLRHRMAAELSQLDRAQAQFQALLAENSRRNAKALELNVGSWEVATKIAEGTRDLSVIVLGIGGTMMTGGAAGGALAGFAASAGASTLGSIAKAQDQGLSLSGETVGKVVGSPGTELEFAL